MIIPLQTNRHKLSWQEQRMAALTMTPTLYNKDFSAGLTTVNLQPLQERPQKRKRHITFFDGDNYEKPRPAVTAVYDTASGEMLSIKTFQEQRDEEEAEFREYLAAKKRKREAAKAKKAAAHEATTDQQDMEKALSELCFNPMDIQNIISN